MILTAAAAAAAAAPAMSSSGDSSDGSLNSLDHFGQYCRFFPRFARERAAAEDRAVLHEFESIFSAGPEPVLLDRSKLVHALRLVRSTEDDSVFATFQDKATVVRHLASLIFNRSNVVDDANAPAIDQGSQTRVLEVLAAFVQRTESDHAPLVWQRPGCIGCQASREELLDLGRCLPFAEMFAFVERTFNRNVLDGCATSVNTRKEQLSALVRLIRNCHKFWDSVEVGVFLEKSLHLNAGLPRPSSAVAYYRIRALLLFASGEWLHQTVEDGRFLRWWALMGGKQVSTWDATFVSLLFRAVKFGWANGRPLHGHLEPFLPHLFGLLQASFLVPNSQKIVLKFNRDNIPGELTSLLAKKLDPQRKLCKILAFLLPPLAGAPDQLLAQRLWAFVEVLVAEIEPLSHPSNTGDWTNSVAKLVKQLVSAYCCRISRERMSAAVTRASVGRIAHSSERSLDKGGASSEASPDGEAPPLPSYRLGPAEDERVVNLFLPLCLSGVYSRAQSAATHFESALKRLCYILPDATLDIVLERAVDGVTAVMEAHQLQSALRVITQLLPLIVERRPGFIPQFMDESLRALDNSEPFKAIQALTFQTLAIARLGTMDLTRTNVVTDAASVQLLKLLFPVDTPSPLISLRNYPREARGSEEALEREMARYKPAALKDRLEESLQPTALLASWLHLWLDNMLRFIGSTTKTEKGSESVMATVERTLSLAARFLVFFATRDGSRATVEAFSQTLLEALTSGPNTEVAKLYGSLVRGAVQGKPGVVVNAILPKLLARQRRDTLGPKLRAFELTAMAAVCRCPGEFLLPYRNELSWVVVSALRHSNKEVAKAGVKVARRVVESCIGVYQTVVPNETDLDVIARKAREFSYGEQPWWLLHADELQATPIDGGLAGTPPLPVHWHVPTADELRFAEHLVGLQLTAASKLLHLCLPTQQLERTDGSLPSAEEQPAGSMLDTLRRQVSSLGLDSLGALFRQSSLVPLTQDEAAQLVEQPFDGDTAVLSTVKLLSRVFGIARHALKAVSCAYPDETPAAESEQRVTITPLASDLGARTTRFVADVSIAVARAYLGLRVDAERFTVHAEKPLVDLMGVGDSTVSGKIIGTIGTALGRPLCVGSIFADAETRSSFWCSLNPWTSVCYATHTLSAWQDMLKPAWLERVHCAWARRCERRTQRKAAVGWRRDLALIAARLANSLYAKNREAAQEILRVICTHHYGLRTNLSNFFLADIKSASLKLKELQHSEEAPEAATSEVSGLEDERPPASDVLAAMPVTKQVSHTENELDLCYARLTGCCHSLANPQMMRRLWATPELVAATADALLTALRAPITRDQVQQRLFRLCQHVLDARQQLLRGKDYVSHALVEPVLQQLRSGNPQRWQWTLLATAFAITLAGKNSATDSQRVQRSYREWLATACDAGRFFPLLNTLASFGLALETSGQFLDQANVEVADRIAASLPFSHRRAGKRSGYSEAGNAIVISVVKLDRTWPFDRFGRAGSKLSLHNVLVVQQMIQRAKDPRAVARTWTDAAATFLEQPLTEQDFHVAACEVVAGVSRAVADWEDTSDKQKIWAEGLAPLLTRAIKTFDAALFADLVDAVRYGAAVSDTPSLDADGGGDIAAAVPFINFALNAEERISVDQVTARASFGSSSSDSSSLEIARRLELTRMLCSCSLEATELLTPRVQPVLHDLMSHSSKLIRANTADLLATLLYIKSSRECPSSLARQLQSVQDLLEEAASAVLPWTEELDASILQRGKECPQYSRADTIVSTLQRVHKSCAGHVFSADMRFTALALSLAVARHRLEEVSDTAWSAAAFAVAALNGIDVHDECRVDFSSEQAAIGDYTAALSKLIVAPSWRVRQSAARLIELIVVSKRMNLVGSAALRQLVDAAKAGLNDAQAEVQAATRAALLALCVVMDCQQCKALTKAFVAEGGRPEQTRDRSVKELLPPVLGLSALVLSRPYSVPDWLPETLTALARYGNSRTPHAVRREVEQSLQEFLRTHQDSWRQTHEKKFTPEQLDLLESQRGRPVYFG